MSTTGDSEKLQKGEQQDDIESTGIPTTAIPTASPASPVVNHRHTTVVSSSTAAETAVLDTEEQAQASRNNNKSKLTPPPTPKASLHVVEVGLGQPMEIDDNKQQDDELLIHDDEEDDDDIDADLERLLGDIATSSTTGISTANSRTAVHAEAPCARCYRHQNYTRTGNTLVIFPRIYARTRWGIVGPHYFGPLLVLLILLAAAHHFVSEARDIGPVTTIICVLLTLTTAYNLFSVAFRDPGIVTSSSHPPENIENLSQWRWCDLCNVYQPPDGQHCPDCNVCIEGYDHHCVWMGTCIGKNNMPQFIKFNLSWLGNLLYALIWVSFVGPSMYNKKH